MLLLAGVLAYSQTSQHRCHIHCSSNPLWADPCSCSSTYLPSGLGQHQVSSRPDGDHEGEGSAVVANEAEPKKGGRAAWQTARLTRTVSMGAFKTRQSAHLRRERGH